jgi:hypothetical protein
MKQKRFKLIAVLLLGLGLTGVKAQDAIPVSGGNALGSGGSASYSVGLVVYTTNTGTNGSVAQGIQQPFEISVISGIEDAKGITLQYSVCPNPATDFLILKTEGKLQMQCIASLYDLNGKLLKSKKIEGNETNIEMSNLVSAIYFLKIIANKKEIKTFKIIKR